MALNDVSPSHAEGEPHPTRNRKFLLGFFLLAILFSVGQAHRSSGGVLSSVFWDEFGLSPSLIAFLVGAMFIAQGLGQLPGGVFVDRLGTRRTLAIFAIVAAIGCAVAALSSGWHGVLLGRILIGIGFAPMLNGAVRYFLEWTGGDRLSTITGRFLSIGMVGGLLGTGPLAVAIELYGWRIVYIAIAFLTVVLGIVLFLVLQESPDGNAASRPKSSMKEVLSGLATVARDPEIRPILFVAPFLYAPSQILVGLWAGPYLADIHGLDIVTRGFALTVMMIGMGTGVLVYGPIETRLGKRKPIVIAGALLVAFLLAALALVGHLSMVLAVALSTAVIFASTFFVVVISHGQSMFSKEYSGRAFGMIGLLGVSGVFASQSLTAWILSLFPEVPGATGSLEGYQAIFLTMAAIFVAIAAIYTRTREIPLRRMAEQVAHP